MWASGTNMNVRKDVFNYERFDPQLLRSGNGGEDVDFSFRVYKRFGANSILFQPKAKLVHNIAPIGRVSKYDLMLMRKIHKIYLSHKNGEKRGSFKEALAQFWYNFGYLLFCTSKICKGDYKSLFYFFATQYQALLHRQDIKNLNIEWMNLKLFNEKSIPKAKIIETHKI